MNGDDKNKKVPVVEVKCFDNLLMMHVLIVPK